MPIVQATFTKKLSKETKRDLMDFIGNEICSNTSTLIKNIYIYIHELEPENVLKLAPTVIINWTMMPDRIEEVERIIMKGITEKIAEIEPEYKDEIVIIFNHIPLYSAMLGGETRLENPINNPKHLWTIGNEF